MTLSMQKLLLLLIILSSKFSQAQSQLVIGDCTITYSITGSNQKRTKISLEQQRSYT